MRGNFRACIRIVLPHEGGYVHDRHDPGGETAFGISKRSYPQVNIKALTVEGAITIYERDYWPLVRGDDLPPGVDLAVLDPAINSGVSRASRWLQRAAGMPVKAQDGAIGPATLAVVRDTDPVRLVRSISAIRMGFLRGLRTWGRYGKGWSRRVADIEARGVAMALAGVPAAPLKQRLQSEGAQASRNAAQQRQDGAAAGIAGGGGLTLPDLPDWALWACAAALLIIIVNLVGRARHNRDRAAAYAAVASEVK